MAFAIFVCVILELAKASLDLPICEPSTSLIKALVPQIIWLQAKEQLWNAKKSVDTVKFKG